MSENDTRAEGAGAPDETGRPSVKLVRNAKGDMQIEVKAYGSTDELGVAEAGSAAEAEMNRLVGVYPFPKR